MKHNEVSPLDLIIVGASASRNEALWVEQRQNEAGSKQICNVPGFADDNPELVGASIDRIPMLGSSRAEKGLNRTNCD